MSPTRKALVFALIGYLARPFDLAPDFILVAGQLDDAILVAAVLRPVTRSGVPELLTEHWPGREASPNVIMRLAFGPAGQLAATHKRHRTRSSLRPVSRCTATT